MMAILLEHCLYLLFLLFLIPLRLFFQVVPLFFHHVCCVEITRMAALAGRPRPRPAQAAGDGCIVGSRYAAAGGMHRGRISNNFQTNLHVSNTGGRWLEGLRVRSCQCRFPTRTEYSYYSDSDGKFPQAAPRASDSLSVLACRALSWPGPVNKHDPMTSPSRTSHVTCSHTSVN